MATSGFSFVFTGFIGNEPELRYTPAGKPVLNLSVAVNKSWKDGDEWKEKTQWYKVALWNEKAEYAHKTAHKGSLVTVFGDWLDAKAFTSKNGEGIELLVTANRVIIGEKPEKSERVEDDDEQNIPF